MIRNIDCCEQKGLRTRTYWYQVPNSQVEYEYEYYSYYVQYEVFFVQHKK